MRFPWQLLSLFETIIIALAAANAQAETYRGKYCEGTGDVELLKLLDQSFAFFHADPNVPNLTMLYEPNWDTFAEGAGWQGWWIQNSYGFAYSVTPFLQEPWFSTLQRSLDLFWNNQGDGKRKGLWGGNPSATPLYSLVAPDGCLGDCANPKEIVYKQGDGDISAHDWFHEATAAGVIMQSEILLASRDKKAISAYLPKMDRACNSIERTRDPKNNLFLVGPACNLLAPSFGGVKLPDGKFGRSYLAGLSISYAAAAQRMIELYKIVGDERKQKEYERRLKITLESLSQLTTPKGYFVKSLEQNGQKHGVLGQRQFGYLEGVSNADAIALRVVDDAAARSIYKQIAVFSAIRPFDFLMTNAPSLDDTYVAYGSPSPGSIFQYGCWVNGGVWGTVEGRAILGYYRVGAIGDVRRSAERALKWAKDFRMDDHLTQCGDNTDNLWYDKAPHNRESVAVAIDNFAIPGATIRGLFDYDYRSDRLVLRPRLPQSITEYSQKEPIRFGEKRLFIICRNGGMKVKSIAINGKPINLESSDAVVLNDADLPVSANIEIVTEGGWQLETSKSVAPAAPAIKKIAAAPKRELPDSLKKRYVVLKKLNELLLDDPKVRECDRAFVREALGAIEAWQARTAVEPQGCFRPMTPAKRDLIVKFYEDAAVRMYDGLVNRMPRYRQSSDAGQKRFAELFEQASR